MNKGIFTLMTAALLTAGSGVTPAFADITPYSTVNKGKTLANGVKFYLQQGTSYYKAVEIKIKNDAKVWSLATTSDASEASVFEVSNYAAIGGQYTFSLSVNGKIISLTSDGAVSSDDASLDKNKFVTTFITEKNKLSEIAEFSASLKDATDLNVTLATSVEELSAKDLNEYNTKGFTFGFAAKTDLVGNAFAQPMYAVGADNGIYFVVDGTEKALKALKEDFEEDQLLDDVTLLKNKDVKVIALNKDKKYDVKAAETTAYQLQVVAGDKISENSAVFTVTEFDQLANPDEYELMIKSPANSANLYVGAVRYTATDTKTYVTTVEDKSQLIHATLGSSTYLAPSVLLKEGIASYVNIYFTSSKESQKDKFQTEYHKYLVAGVRGSSFVFNAEAADDINFTSSTTQWVVTDFDGKYTFTLANEETNQVIELSLQESEVSGEYDIVAAKDGNGNSVSFGNLITAENDFTPKTIADATVKFIPATKANGFLNLTKEEMEAGVRLAFTGKTALIGEKTFYAQIANTNLKPNMDASKQSVISIEKAKQVVVVGEDAVADYLMNVTDIVYLKNGKLVEAKDTLLVPTYKLYFLEDSEDPESDKCYLGNNATFAETNTAEFFFKSVNGAYVMGITDGNIDYNQVIKADIKAVSVNPITGTNFVNTENVYGIEGDDFAYVTVQVNDNSDKTTLPAQPRHASFDNLLGSISMQLNANGINEGVLGETMTFWLDTADSKAVTPFFYISRGIAVAEGEEVPAERMFMYNASDSLSIFNEGSAQATLNPNYKLEGTADNAKIAKVIFRSAKIAAIDTINTVVDGEAAIVAKEANRAEGVLGGLDNFKFGIRLADEAVTDEYVIYSKADERYVYALNGKLGLTDDPREAMIFTLGDEVPTSNESIDAEEASVKVIAGNGVVTVQGAVGQTVTVATVLGKVVANEVVTSDNATIAAPAGVVFVTVGGETVKVAVK